MRCGGLCTAAHGGTHRLREKVRPVLAAVTGSCHLPQPSRSTLDSSRVLGAEFTRKPGQGCGSWAASCAHMALHGPRSGPSLPGWHGGCRFSGGGVPATEEPQPYPQLSLLRGTLGSASRVPRREGSESPLNSTWPRPPLPALSCRAPPSACSPRLARGLLGRAHSWMDVSPTCLHIQTPTSPLAFMQG